MKKNDISGFNGIRVQKVFIMYAMTSRLFEKDVKMFAKQPDNLRYDFFQV